jgi:hypothetical protein
MNKRILLTLLLIGSVSGFAPLWAAQAVIYRKAVDAAGKYCHLKFPAIQKKTLYSGRPVLKDASDGDIVDFYGPCDYDPLGREEVMRQRADLIWERNRLVDND